MDTSPQKAKQLLVLQSAAGILNVSVDELLQLQRVPSPAPLTLGGGSSRSQYVRTNSKEDGQQHGGSPLNGSDDIFPPHSRNHNFHRQQHHASHFADFPSFTSETQALERYSSQAGSYTTESTSQERVILLNPEIEHAMYACNRDFQFVEFGDISGSDQNNPSGSDGYIQVPLGYIYPDAESESTARDDDVDMLSADEDDRTVPVSTPADTWSSSSTGSRQYKMLAPRPGAVKSESSGSSPGGVIRRVRKKRAPYSASRRLDTNLTRSLNACVRCRIQRNRVCGQLLHERRCFGVTDKLTVCS